jgi:hypothetical protein
VIARRVHSFALYPTRLTFRKIFVLSNATEAKDKQETSRGKSESLDGTSGRPGT